MVLGMRESVVGHEHYHAVDGYCAGYYKEEAIYRYPDPDSFIPSSMTLQEATEWATFMKEERARDSDDEESKSSIGDSE